MSNNIEDDIDSINLKRFESEIQEWVSENAPIIIDYYNDFTSSTRIMDDPEEKRFIELEGKNSELERKIKEIIYLEDIRKIPYIYHRLIIKVITLLINPDIRNSAILNTVTAIYISVLLDLKTASEKYSSLEPYQQFLPETFYFITNCISKDKNLVDIIDEDFWKDRIFKKIMKKEENKLLRHSLRSLILYCNTIHNRKRRLFNLKK